MKAEVVRQFLDFKVAVNSIWGQYWMLQVVPDLSQTTTQSTQTVPDTSTHPWSQPNNKTVHSDSTDCFKSALTLAKQQDSPLSTECFKSVLTLAKQQDSTFRQYRTLQVSLDLGQTTTQSTQTVPTASRRPWPRLNVDRPSSPLCTPSRHTNARCLDASDNSAETEILQQNLMAPERVLAWFGVICHS